MSMSWKELARFIDQRMTDEQKEQNLTVYEDGEFFQGDIDITGENPDVLDPNSFYIYPED